MRKALAFIAAVWLQVFNRYEGGQRWSPDRSWLPSMPPQDARYDIDPPTRLELCRKSDYFERNSALYNRLVDLFEQFTVGPNGLQFVPASLDEDYNSNAQSWWDEWCKFCDLTTLQTFATIQSLCARSWFQRGEIFILKTFGQEKTTKAGEPIKRPRIQLIESHRVETPSSRFQEEGVTIIDGVEINRIGRPVAYWVRNENFNSAFSTIEATHERIPADKIIHIFEPSRPGQYRGLPFCYAVLNDLHDLDDLQILEMRAAKDAAEKSNIITNTAGELSGEKLQRQRFQAVTQDSQGAEVTQNRVAQIKSTLGGRTVALKRGEDIKQFASERPSVATREYWDYLTSKVCAGVGISKLLVFPWSIQGTVARADLDIANAFFRARSAVLIAAFTRVYEWVMDWAVKNDKRLDGAPDDHLAVEVLPPRSVNVDVGRNSAALIAEVESGGATFEDFYGPGGKNWRRELRKKAVQAAYIRKLAEEFKVEVSEISTLQQDRPEQFITLDQNGKQPPAPAAQPKQKQAA